MVDPLGPRAREADAERRRSDDRWPRDSCRAVARGAEEGRLRRLPHQGALRRRGPQARGRRANADRLGRHDDLGQPGHEHERARRPA